MRTVLPSFREIYKSTKIYIYFFVFFVFFSPSQGSHHGRVGVVDTTLCNEVC